MRNLNLSYNMIVCLGSLKWLNELNHISLKPKLIMGELMNSKLLKKSVMHNAVSFNACPIIL